MMKNKLWRNTIINESNEVPVENYKFVRRQELTDP